MKQDVDRYTYRVEWSADDDCHIARCLEFPSLAAHGNSSAAALKEIITAVAAAVEWMKEDGEPLPEPLGQKQYQGKISLRIPPETHRHLAMEAAEQGISLNRLISSRLSA